MNIYNMSRILLYIILTIWSTSVQSQEVYYSSISNLPNGGLQTVIGKFDILSCLKTELFVDTTFVSLEWTDIALCPDGNLYGLSHDGIYFIDISARSYLKILDDPPYPRWEKGLLCTKDSILVFGERDILGLDIASGNLTHYGRLPSSMAIFSNIFYYKNMIMASANNRIILVDTLNPANSSIYCSIDRSGLVSLTEFAISCDSVAVFALFVNGEIYLFDPINFSLTFYCDISSSPNEVFQGTHPDFMFMPPDPCKISIDLDYLDETLPGIDYSDTIYCDVPGRFLFSTIDLFSDKEWDSVKIWIDEGPGQLWLEGENAAFATIEGSGSSHLKYISTGPSDITQLSTTLLKLNLNGSLPPGVTVVKIGFAAWAKNLKSDTAYAFITLIGRAFSAGTSDSDTLCREDLPLTLASLLSSDASLNGTWFPSTSAIGIFNTIIDPPGQFYYIVDDAFCGEDSAVFDISIHSLPVFNLPTLNYICPGDTIVLAVEIENSSIIWSDGTVGSSIQIIESDTLEVFITDEFDCTFSDTIFVLYKDDCILERLYIPNIFSPNGDNTNDEWGIKSDPTILQMEVTIYDRWGDALYFEKSPSINWNGTSSRNGLVSPGVYVYTLALETINHNIIYKTGDVTIIK